MRTPEENTRALCEVMMREHGLLELYGRYPVFLAVLEGAEIKEITCPKCCGSGKVKVPPLDSTRRDYDTRTCLIPDGCDGTGKIRNLQMPKIYLGKKGIQ